MSAQTPEPVATRYEFLPPGALDAPIGEQIEDAMLDAITVLWRGVGRWSIHRGSSWVPRLEWDEQQGGWGYETSESPREMGVTRFDLETALAIGKRLAQGQASVRRLSGRARG